MASRSLGTLTLDLVAKTGGFVQGMSQAERAASKAGDSMAKQATKIGKAFAAFTVAAASGLAYFTKQTINTQNQMYELAQSTGISTESLSAFAYAGEQSGTSIEAIALGMKKLGTAAVEAARGIAEPAKAFEALGVEVQNLDGTIRDSEDLLLDTAGAFAGMEDGAAKTALAVKLFGKAGAALIPFLNEGRDGIEALRKEAEKYGLIVSSESAAASETFNDNLGKLGAIAKGAANQFTTAILPALAAFSDALIEDLEPGLESSRASAVEWGSVFATVVAFTADAVTTGFKFIGTAFESLGTRIGAASAVWVQVLKGNIEEANRLALELDQAESPWTEFFNETDATRWRDLLADTRKALTDTAGTVKDTAAEMAGTELVIVDEQAVANAATALGSIQSLISGLETQIATYEQGAPAVIAYRIAHGDLAASFTAAGAAAEPLKSELIALTEQYESLQEKSKAAAEWQTENAAMAAEAAAVYEATRTPLEQFNATIEELNRQRTTIDPATNAPFLDPETYRRAAEAAQDAFEAATNEVSEFHKRATENIQDIFAEHLRTGFEEGFDGILDSFKQLIVDMLAEAIAADFASALFGKGGLGSGGGLFGFIGDLFGGGRAEGGPVTAGTSYVVGERGAEVFTPRTSGFITPAGSAAAPAGAVSITQNNYISGSNLGPEQMTRILEENNKKLKGEFLQELRRGAYQ